MTDEQMRELASTFRALLAWEILNLAWLLASVEANANIPLDWFTRYRIEQRPRMIRMPEGFRV